MKKKIILLLLLIPFVQLLHAQYFQRNYGTAITEFAYSGEVCDIMGPGHLLGGITIDNGINYNYPTLVRTNVDGLVPGGTTFSRTYRMYQNATLSARMKATECHALELPNGTYAMAGSMYKDHTGQKEAIYYSWVDQNGIPATSWVTIGGLPYNLAYYESDQWHDYYHVDDFILSSTGNEAYIMGHQMDLVTGFNEIFLLKVDVTNGALIFHQSYHIPSSATDGDNLYAMVENPPAGEVAIAGSHDNTNDIDALLLRVSNVNGAVIAAESFGSSSSKDVFHGILLSQGTGNYVLVGSTDVVAADFDVWLMEYDYNMNVVVNSQRYDCSIPGGNKLPDFPADIVERNSTAFGWEYHVAGTTWLPAFGGTDIFTLRVDAGFNPIGGTLYGAPGMDGAMDLDQDNSQGGPIPDGLSIYGMTDDVNISFGQSDMVIHKTYFNGEYPCTRTAPTWVQNPSHPWLGTLTVNTPEAFNEELGYLLLSSNPSVNQVCYIGSMGSGNNNKMMQPQVQATLSVDLNGNITLSDAPAGPFTLEWVSATGQVIHQVTATKPEGNWSLMMHDIQGQVPAGMYLLRAATGTGVSTVRFLIH